MAIYKTFGREISTHLNLYPICDNFDFLPGTEDPQFKVWSQKGLTTLHDLFDGNILMSFDQLTNKYNIPRQDFFRYLQLRDFVKKDTTILEKSGHFSCGKTTFFIQGQFHKLFLQSPEGLWLFKYGLLERDLGKDP